MLEYDDMNAKELDDYNKYDCDLLFNSRLKILYMKINLKELDEDQILGKKELPEGYKARCLKEMSVDEKKYLLDLIKQYPELSEEKLGRKLCVESEFAPWL
jgi:hypothetical protein